MHLEVFAQGETVIHRLDPRAKLLAFFPLSVILALSKGFALPLAGLAIGVVFALGAKLDPRALINRLAGANLFVVFLWVFLPLSFAIGPYLFFGPVKISIAGIFFTLSLTIKINAIILLTISLLGTTQAFSLAHALIHLKAPVKLVYLFFFSYRYITLLHEEYLRLHQALVVRSFHPDTSLHTYKTYACLIGMLLVRSYERAARIYHAMLCRGFDGRFPVFAHFTIQRRDCLFLCVMLALTVALALAFF